MSIRLQYLFDRFLAKTCTAEERQELLGMALEPQMQEKIKQIVEEAWMQTGEEEDVQEERAEAMMEKIFPPASNVQPFSVRNVFPLIWKRIAVAASILLVIGFGSYLLFFNRPAKHREIVKTEPAKDVEAPKESKAMITLANGRKVLLDSLISGTLATQGNVNVVKTVDGQIVYKGISTEFVYNTLYNPKGSRVINMTLADGSKVWLNAGSSLTYPVAFVSNERKVSITGEAYFEVAKNETMPFKVSKDEMEVTVLGTHFNVNAYNDEKDIKVTLLEGSVKVNSGVSSGVLKPGQQAQVTKGLKIANDVDLQEVMAWKNGIFQFEKADIYSIMRQVARWYDVEVLFEEEISAKFGGTVPRNVNVSKLLAILEMTGHVHFKIEGRTITVMP